MTEIFDLLTPGRLIIRRPDGRVYLDSSDRTMVQLGQRSYSNINTSFPKFSSEKRSSIRQTSGGLRQDWSIGKETQSVLGAIGTAAPNWVMVNVFGVDQNPTKTEIFYGVAREYAFPNSQWLPLNGGSLHVETISTNDIDQLPIAHRILTVQPSGNNFVVVAKQASRAASKKDAPIRGFGTAATYTFNFALTWGVFDL